MKIYTANGRNYKFLLLFGVLSIINFESKADPVASFYKRKLDKTTNVRNIVKAKNNIYVNKLKKLRTRDQKNYLYNSLRGRELRPFTGYNSLYNNGFFYFGIPYYQNNIAREWDIQQMDRELDKQFDYMDGYRSRLYPFYGHVFYDHYLSAMQNVKKDHHSFRKFLHKFRVHISMGGGASFVKSNIVGYFFQENGDYYLVPLFFNKTPHSAYKVGWFGESYKKVPKTISRNEYANLDTGEKFYTGCMGSINFVELGLSYDFYKRWRFEIDFNFKGNYLNKLKRHYQVEKNKNIVHAKATPQNVDIVSLPKKTFFSSDFGFLVGVKVLNNTLWSLLMNFNLYGTVFYNGFHLVEGSFVHGLYNFFPGIGGGLTLERHLSDYISLFVRGMFGVEKFGWSDMEENSKCRIMHWLSTFSLNFGINFTTSYIDKCERNCNIKEVHIHNSKEYRGLSKWQYKSPYGKVIHSAE